MPPRLRILGLICVFGALILALVVAGFGLGSGGLPRSFHLWPPKYVGARSFLALGDSYTIGEGVPAERRWPMQLAAHLRAAGTDLSDPHTLAKTGWTTPSLRSAIEQAFPVADGSTFDLVTLLIGVNDQYTRRPVEHFRRDFETVLERALRLARGRSERVVVISLPDWGATPHAAWLPNQPQLAGEIDAYNEVIADVCRPRGIVVVDVTAISRRPGVTWAGDRLHPSAGQYEVWSRQIEPACAAALAR